MNHHKQVTQKQVNDLTYKIIGAAIDVHKCLGPGLLEKVYEAALVRELELRNLQVSTQHNVMVDYKGIPLDCQLRFDLLVEGLIIVEIKAVKELDPIFEAQLLTYMKHAHIPKGILLNFTCTNIYRHGCKTFVNEFFSGLAPA